jgi:hypothetical protein
MCLPQYKASPLKKPSKNEEKLQEDVSKNKSIWKPFISSAGWWDMCIWLPSPMELAAFQSILHSCLLGCQKTITYHYGNYRGTCLIQNQTRIQQVKVEMAGNHLGTTLAKGKQPITCKMYVGRKGFWNWAQDIIWRNWQVIKPPKINCRNPQCHYTYWKTATGSKYFKQYRESG